MPTRWTKSLLEEKLRPHGQEHLVAHFDSLSPAEQNHLAEQILSIDFELYRELAHGSFAEGDEERQQSELAKQAAVPTAMRLDGSGVPFTDEQAVAAGKAALGRGEVGMMIVAGGLGTRLGFDKPKGMFPLGPLSHRTLFQIFCEQLLALGRRYQKPVPLYVMTSPATHAETESFLRENRWFGLAERDVRLFCQAMLWSFDAQTKRLLLESRGSLFTGPDGHGGMLQAFAKSGALADAQARGLKHLSYGQIDNPLTSICDPRMLGSHLLAKSEMTTQVVAKRDAAERVGNVVAVNGRMRMIEYIHLPQAIAERRNADGSLMFWAGNVAVHVFDLSFLNRMSTQKDALPLHHSLKKVPFVDESGKLVQPAQPNAWRFERFIFDLLPHAENALLVEADRNDTFAPVKNGEHEPFDNARTARAAMSALHARWLRAAGAIIEPNVTVEINPLWGLDAAEVAGKVQPGLRITRDTYFAE